MRQWTDIETQSTCWFVHFYVFSYLSIFCISLFKFKQKNMPIGSSLYSDFHFENESCFFFQNKILEHKF